MSTNTGGQSRISSFNCFARPRPPTGEDSPSRIANATSPASMCSMTTAAVAMSTYSMSPSAGSGRVPTADRTWARVAALLLYTSTRTRPDGLVPAVASDTSRCYRAVPGIRIETATADMYSTLLRRSVLDGDDDRGRFFGGCHRERGSIGRNSDESMRDSAGISQKIGRDDRRLRVTSHPFRPSIRREGVVGVRRRTRQVPNP